MALETKFLIIPCCKSKHGSPQHIKTRSIDDFLSCEATDLLHQTRQLAFRHPCASLDLTSELSPALYLYSGTMYSVEGFRDAIERAISLGMHVLVESGGYGLIRIEESIRNYEAPINRTAPVWRRVLPRVLADYVSKNNIDQVFVAGSKSYVSVLSRPDWWGTAECRWFVSSVRRGNGNAFKIVPRNLGSAVRDLIQSNCETAATWATIADFRRRSKAG
jgi:hypothetical protein